MANYPTLSVSPMVGSKVSREIKLFTHQFGDGYTSRIPQGINNMPRSMSFVYDSLSPADHAILLAFMESDAGKGYTCTVPVWPEDASGNKKALFYITDFDYSASEGGVLWQWTINFKEVFA